MVNSFISLGHHEISHGEISLGDHEISHGEISPGYQENLLVNKFPVFTVRKNIFMLENVQCVALEFLFNPQTLMCVTPL